MTCREIEQKVMPYIKGKLSYLEMKEFLEHIRGCENCSEELEIHYTIHRALDQLENEPDASYDIHYLLEENLKAAELKVRSVQAVRFYKKATGLIAAAALFISLIMQIILWGM